MTKDSYTIPFGKYKGQELDELPAIYLLWLDEQEWVKKFPEICDYIASHRKALELESLK